MAKRKRGMLDLRCEEKKAMLESMDVYTGKQRGVSSLVYWKGKIET